jgi:hypothetical protein
MDNPVDKTKQVLGALKYIMQVVVNKKIETKFCVKMVLSDPFFVHQYLIFVAHSCGHTSSKTNQSKLFLHACKRSPHTSPRLRSTSHYTSYLTLLLFSTYL